MMPDTRPAIAHIKDHFLPASETFIYALLQAANRYRPIVLDRHSRQNETVFQFEAHYSPVERFGHLAGLIERASLRSLGRSPFLERVMRKENARLIHAHFGQLGALFVPVARRLGLPLVTTFYGEDATDFVFRPEWRPRFEALWSYAELVLVLGPEMAGRLREAGFPGDKIETVPLPVDMNRFERMGVRKPDDGRPVRILSIARLVPVKGMETLLSAVAGLRTRHSFELWIGGDGPERPRLEDQAERLGLGASVRFLGWVGYADVPEIMAQCDLFILASRNDPVARQTEGTPTVLLEAQAAGLPVVATQHGDIPHIMKEGETGILVPESNPDALALAVEALLTDAARRLQLGLAGRAFVKERHASTIVAEHVEKIYNAVLEAI